MIKKNQIKSLQRASKYKGVIAGFILNFRKTNQTYFVSIQQFSEMIKTIDKKSFNQNDIISVEAYQIEQKLKRVRYTYNIEKFISDMQFKYNK